jgi:hypothetical protein
LEIVEKVMEVDLPIEFGVCGLWKVSTSLLTTAPTLEQLFVDTERVVEVLTRPLLKMFTNLHDTLRALVVHSRLSTDDIGFIVLLRHHRVPRRKFIYTGGAVSHVLSGDVYGHFDVKFEFNHFEWGCVPMSKEISDEASVSTGGFGTVTVGYSGGLYD